MAWQRINSKKKLALEYDIGKITVAHWRRNWLILKQFSSQKFSEESLNRKNVKKLEFEKKTSEPLFMWFTQQRQKGAPISGQILQEKSFLIEIFCRRELAVLLLARYG